MAAEESLFGLTRLVSASDVRLSARCENGRRQMLAFVTGSGHLTLHYAPAPDVLPTIKVVTWFLDTTKRISAMTFDPSGAWLLVAGNDGTVYLVPALALVDPSAPTDHRWAADDVTATTTSLRANRGAGAECRVSRPTAVAWWQCGTDCQHLAVVGTDRGDIVFVSLTAGVQVGATAVKSAISEIHVCQDNCLDNVFLLITGEQRCQWKLLVEQRSTGYVWPLDLAGKPGDGANAEGVPTSRAAALPTARSRLQGLKQLSVEKLASMRQRLAEARSKGGPKEVRVRRGSNGSSSDESQRSRLSSEGSEWAGPDARPTPTRLGARLGQAFLQPQRARGLHLLSALHQPSATLTVHGMALESVPLFVHKLPPHSRDALLTDRFLFVVDDDAQSLRVVSTHFAESRLDGDTDFNPDSVVDSFALPGDERVVAAYKRTCDSRDGKARDRRSRSKSRSRSRSAERAPFALPSCAADVDVQGAAVDGCVLVTTAGVYEIALRRPAVEKFLALVLERQELEQAERLAAMFGLDLLRLLEAAGDLKLAQRQFAPAIALYKLSRCRHLKSVLKFAAAGHSRELLTYVETLFGAAAGADVTQAERMHLANLAVMAHVDQVLRTLGKARQGQQKAFLRFLSDNGSYDAALAVTVCGQARRWDALALLSSAQGLRSEVLDALARILRDSGEPVDQESPGLDEPLWQCLSDPGLLPALLTKPAHCAAVLNFVCRCLPLLPAARLAVLAAALDPSAPEMRPLLRRDLARRRRVHSTASNDSIGDGTENGEDSSPAPTALVAQAFLLVSLRLAQARAGATFDPALVTLETEAPGDRPQSQADTELPVRESLLAAGFGHSALVRNAGLFVWGATAAGCLGGGPSVARHLLPQQVSLLPALRVEVLSVSCGRTHTLALTTNGVYAWGSNRFGQLGVGPGVRQSPWPALVRALAREPLAQVCAGQYHSVALTRDGRVFTWGWGVHGQLGTGSAEDSLSPALVPLDQWCVRVAAGHAHTLLLLADGAVRACGASVFGQLGSGGNAKSSVPVVVEIGERVVDIATGYFHSLALTESGRLVTWGASPQVLRLQAQAQKKARLMQAHFAQQASPDRPATTPPAKPESPEAAPPAQSQRVPAPLVTPAAPSVQGASAADDGAREPGSNSADTNESDTNSAESSTDFDGSGRAELDERPLVKKSFTQSVQDYFAEHKGALDGSGTAAKRGHSAGTELSEINQKKKDSPSSPPSPGNKEKTRPGSPGKPGQPQLLGSPTKPSQSPGSPTEPSQSPGSPTKPGQSHGSPTKPSQSPELSSELVADGDGKTSEEPTAGPEPRGVPAIVISPTLDDKEVKKATQAAKRAALRNLLLEDSATAHLSPRAVDLSLVSGAVVGLACGCHHSALVTAAGAVHTWGRGLDGQLGAAARREVAAPAQLPDVRATQVACGCDFTLALDGQSGRVWAWGSNCSAQLGTAPLEDSKSADGKVLVIKTMKRVIKLPHGSQNSVDSPREVPRLPAPAISYRQSRYAGPWPDPLRALAEMDAPAFGPRSLHHALQKLHGLYDARRIAKESVACDDHQASAKVALLERRVDEALAWQLKALALAGGSDSNGSVSSPDVGEIHLFSIQGGNEEMSEGRQELTSPSDTASSMSRESSGYEVDKMASPSAELQSDVADANRNVPAETATAALDSPGNESLTTVDNRTAVDDNDNGVSVVGSTAQAARPTEAEAQARVANRRMVAQACRVVDCYLLEAEPEGPVVIGRLLQRAAECWLAEALPLARLEEALERRMDLVAQPLGLLLFNDAIGSSALLGRLSARFCLRLCAALMALIDQSESPAEASCLLAAGSAPPSPRQLVAAILDRLGAGQAPCVVLADQVINGCADDRLFVFSCGHSFAARDMRTATADCPQCGAQPRGAVALL